MRDILQPYARIICIVRPGSRPFPFVYSWLALHLRILRQEVSNPNCLEPGDSLFGPYSQIYSAEQQRIAVDC